jgi:hypothetical protein
MVGAEVRAMEVGPTGALKPRAAALAKSIFGLDESASVGRADEEISKCRAAMGGK